MQSNYTWIAALSVVSLTTVAYSDSRTDTTAAVVKRLLPNRATEFDFKLINPANGLDVFEIEARDGRVTICGNTPVAMSRGFYHYLKQSCGCLVTWDGDQLRLPEKLPDLKKTRVVCPNRYRHYFNVCTFGYTTAFWDWPRWEREIDSMALHGINNPLAMVGQEAPWQIVWREFGLTDDEIRSFFTGPAFLPWHRMGNINHHAGPLPQSWIGGQAELQNRILARMRELGMKPVVPAFAGFVPPAFVTRNPDAKVRRSAAWAGFEPTYLLDPAAPLFRKIGKRFIEVYRQQFGSDHLYLADVFNEMTPQVSGDRKLDDLKAVGRAVYDSIVAGDPDGIWVMQGWLFYNERHFWGVPEVEALLGGVPDERMILLDLAGESFEVWRQHAAFRRKPWIWNLLHNFGQVTQLQGDIERVAKAPVAALNDANHGNMVGMGLTMEGIEQNAVVYELMTDTMWRTEPLDVGTWIKDYIRQRYGATSPALEEAWSLMLKRFYTSGGLTTHSAYQVRPSLELIGEPQCDLAATRRIVERLLDGPPVVKESPLYWRDLVDVTKALAADAIEISLYRIALAADDHKWKQFDDAVAEFADQMKSLDAILATVPQHRLDRWIDSARRCAASPAEKNLLERNARMQVTVWGGPVLYDYARKEWSGLVADFYLPRWQRLFDAVRAEKYDSAAFRKGIAEWELAWCEPRPERVPSSQPANDAVALCKGLLHRTRAAAVPVTDPGIAVGKKATDSGGTEGDHKPALAVDGRAGGGYWAASPAPRWWQVDLGESRRIGRVVVYPYCDGSRYYQYEVLASTDGEEWNRIVDMTANTTPAPRRGHAHALPKPVDARFIRVDMLKNSANVGVHLHEVRVFQK